LALLVALLAAGLAAAGCARGREWKLEGRTMGTTYHVTVVAPTEPRGLAARIDARLDSINRVFSTYVEDSELNVFSRFDRAGEPFPASADFLAVMRVSARVHDLSGGAWDATVRPLVDLWGFGPARPRREPPPAAAIDGLLPRVGFDAIEIRPGALVKRQAGVALDLSSIAKGFGVDAVAALLRTEGFRDVLVEIGGEVVGAGGKPDGRPWRVGINRPRSEAALDEIDRVAELRDAALATSGDYRVFFESGGTRYSHVLDPRTGRPVSNGVVSVSVLAPDCTLADGLATAVMVMGKDDGLALLERLPDVEGLVVVGTADGRLLDHATSGFRSEPVR
jgi:thiamine biosynthesis lipoprotein